MATAAFVVPKNRVIEDPLVYLPCSKIVEYRRGQVIYGPEQSSDELLLIIEGKVKICRLTDDNRQVLVDIYASDEFFGESAFLGLSNAPESAVALENTQVMSWSLAEIEEIATRRPKLAIALFQLLVQRSTDLVSRLGSFAIDTVPRRLALALIRFSERFSNDDDADSNGAGPGFRRMIPLTHELLSQYVGTSRELVTHFMSQFRRDGYVQYSRQVILLHREGLIGWLQQSTEAGRQVGKDRVRGMPRSSRSRVPVIPFSIHPPTFISNHSPPFRQIAL